MNNVCGYTMMFLTAFSYGLGAIVIKLAYLNGMTANVLLPMQNIVSVVCLWPILFISYGIPKINKGQLKSLIIQGLIGNMGISICWFWAAESIDVSLLTVIMFTYPGLVLLYQMIIEKRKTQLFEWLAFGLVFLGAICVVEPFGSTTLKSSSMGILLAFGAALTYAFMNVYGEKLSFSMPPQLITAVTTTISTIGMMFIFNLSQVFKRIPPFEEWIYIVSASLLTTILPMNLMYFAIKRIGAFSASIISVSELPWILIMAYYIIGERMEAAQIIGGLCILFSILILQISGHLKAQKEAVSSFSPYSTGTVTVQESSNDKDMQ